MPNINEYNKIYQSALKILKILNVLPYHYAYAENEYIFVKRAIEIITKFLNLKIITQDDIKIINEIINVANPEILFDCYLFQIDKEFCDKEFNKYLDNPTQYSIPNLEEYIDNGEFLKLYIEYKIDMYKEQKTKEKQEKGNVLSKTI